MMELKNMVRSTLAETFQYGGSVPDTEIEVSDGALFPDEGVVMIAELDKWVVRKYGARSGNLLQDLSDPIPEFESEADLEYQFPTGSLCVLTQAADYMQEVRDALHDRQHAIDSGDDHANMTHSRIVGRKAGTNGTPELLTATEVRELINVDDGANNYTLESHSHDLDDISDSGDAAGKNVGTGSNDVAAGDHGHNQLHDRSHSIDGSSDHASMTANRIVGRKDTAGTPQQLTGADARAVIGAGTGDGDVSGPATSTNQAVPKWDGTGGDALLDSGLVIDNNDALQMDDNEIVEGVLKDYGETMGTEATSGSAHEIDLEDGNVHEVTLSEGCTFTFSNPPASGTAGSFTLILHQDGSGSREVTWPGTVEWPGGDEPELSMGANETDILVFITTDAGATWYGMLAGAAFATPA